MKRTLLVAFVLALSVAAVAPNARAAAQVSEAEGAEVAAVFSSTDPTGCFETDVDAGAVASQDPGSLTRSQAVI